MAPANVPPALTEGVKIVAASLRLPPDWLNTGPALQMRFGLPPGFRQRLTWRTFDALSVGLASRRDLICLKLFAAADHWPARGVHFRDLLALDAEPEELAWAAEWVATQDASPEFPRLVDAVLRGLATDVGK